MMDLIFEKCGLARCVYGETFPLGSLGEVSIQRASSVEPISGGTWTADLGTVGGPVLGPFPNRSTAIQAEMEWLTLHWL